MDLLEKMKALNQGYNSDLELAGVVSSTTANQDSEDFSDDFLPREFSIQSYLTGSKKPSKGKPAKRKKTIFDDPELDQRIVTSQSIFDQAHEAARQLMEDEDLAIAGDFDSFISSDIFAQDEDDEMKNHLVAMGRKYHRDTAISPGASEIQKSFADSEQRLKKLYEEVSQDKADVQLDIKRMRVPGRGGKALSDMAAVKNSLHNTQLQIVKEINGMRKLKFELQAKLDAKKEAENAGGNDISANTIQQLFSSSRQSIIRSAGGYASVSGSQQPDAYSSLDFDNMSDDEIEAKYYHPESQTDGDKFLEYEDRGVKMILFVDHSFNTNGVIAEDKDGICIPDYPLPEVDSLEFTFDKVAMTATDNMHRNYVVRFTE